MTSHRHLQGRTVVSYCFIPLSPMRCAPSAKELPQRIFSLCYQHCMGSDHFWPVLPRPADWSLARSSLELERCTFENSIANRRRSVVHGDFPE